MTVAELIAGLSQLPPDTLVVCECGPNGSYVREANGLHEYVVGRDEGGEVTAWRSDYTAPEITAVMVGRGWNGRGCFTFLAEDRK